MSLLQRAWSGLRAEVVLQEFDEILWGEGQYSETALEVNNFSYYPAEGGFTYFSVLYCFSITPNFYASVKYHPRKNNHSTTLNTQWQHYNIDQPPLITTLQTSQVWQENAFYQSVDTQYIVFKLLSVQSPHHGFCYFSCDLDLTDLWLAVPAEILMGLTCIFLPSFLRDSLVATTPLTTAASQPATFPGRKLRLFKCLAIQQPSI